MYSASEIPWSSSSGQNIGENEYACLAGIKEKTLKCVKWQATQQSRVGILVLFIGNILLPFSQIIHSPIDNEHWWFYSSSLCL